MSSRIFASVMENLALAIAESGYGCGLRGGAQCMRLTHWQPRRDRLPKNRGAANDAWNLTHPRRLQRPAERREA
jgi:hypothetical protein